MILIILSLISSFALSFAADPPTITQSELNAIAGEWSGQLMYLDYGDESTWMYLEARVTAEVTDNGLVTHTTIVEPNGEEVVSEGMYKVVSSGKRIQTNEKSWMVSGNSATKNGTTITFQGPGQDDNRSAQIINKLFISVPDSTRQDSIVISKQVLYEGAPKEILRSKLRLGRISE